MTHYFMGRRAGAPAEARRRPDQLPASTAKFDGQPLATENVLGTLRLLLIAGIDTTWSAIGSCLWHLAKHPRTAGGWSRSRS